ncbi:unnamed protein product [Rangifer tarandus platyrhynchus]|uniref:Uncharacterized protein n=1 Tax=Rangifer tarandus platyrhynchus TaxID=3082113 RepID=A0AC59ZYJ8_RANTA
MSYVRYPSFADASKGDDLLPAGTEDYIHIRIQQRNGRKTLTTVQGIADDYDKKKLVKAFKKKFACNGTVIEHPEYGEVIQLQGDQRKNICQFLVEIGLAKDNQLKPSAPPEAPHKTNNQGRGFSPATMCSPCSPPPSSENFTSSFTSQVMLQLERHILICPSLCPLEICAEPSRCIRLFAAHTPARLLVCPGPSKGRAGRAGSLEKRAESSVLLNCQTHTSTYRKNPTLASLRSHPLLRLTAPKNYRQSLDTRVPSSKSGLKLCCQRLEIPNIC